jgi:hypothetical protein
MYGISSENWNMNVLWSYEQQRETETKLNLQSNFFPYHHHIQQCIYEIFAKSKETTSKEDVDALLALRMEVQLFGCVYYRLYY